MKKQPKIIKVKMIFQDNRPWDRRYWDKPTGEKYKDGIPEYEKIFFEKKDKQEAVCNFFGGYKQATVQFHEFLYYEIRWWDTTELMYRNVLDIIDVKICDREFGYGGAKWWDEGSFQKYIGTKEYQFYYHKGIDREVRRMYIERLRGLK